MQVAKSISRALSVPSALPTIFRSPTPMNDKQVVAENGLNATLTPEPRRTVDGYTTPSCDGPVSALPYVCPRTKPHLVVENDETPNILVIKAETL
jgi:hypothetical protein